MMMPGGNALMAKQNALTEQLKDVPEIPPQINKQEFFAEVEKKTMKDDYSCAAGPPKMNDEELPGLRYGASLEIRPKLLVLPCPCPGGVFNKAWRDSSGNLQPGGLWAHWPKPETEEHTSLPPLFHEPQPGSEGVGMDQLQSKADLQSKTGNMKNKTGDMKNVKSSDLKKKVPSDTKELTSMVADKPNSFSAIGGALKGAAGSATGVGGLYHAGSEPYSADYGCLKGFKMSDGPVGGMQPGKRWWNMPDHAEVAISTPCPCMLGAYTDLQPKLHDKLDEALAAERGQASDDWSHTIDDRYFLGVPKVPEWQTAGSLRMGGLGSAVAVLLAGLAACRCRSCWVIPPTLQSCITCLTCVRCFISRAAEAIRPATACWELTSWPVRRDHAVRSFL
ncbi:unnamed protein product [Effrenium voratum]|nr:unnamed protein product [Effrenium voratum]